jgi:hypothetical protein
MYVMDESIAASTDLSNEEVTFDPILMNTTNI